MILKVFESELNSQFTIGDITGIITDKTTKRVPRTMGLFRDNC